MNRSIGPDGAAVGSAAEDMANFVHKLGQHGRDFGLAPSEINLLESSAMAAYYRRRRVLAPDGVVVALDPDPSVLLTPEMFDLCFFRRVIGEVHRRISQRLPSLDLACHAVRSLFQRTDERAAAAAGGEFLTDFGRLLFLFLCDDTNN
jgi:hypothetical protein